MGGGERGPSTRWGVSSQRTQANLPFLLGWTSCVYLSHPLLLVAPPFGHARRKLARGPPRKEPLWAPSGLETPLPVLLTGQDPARRTPTSEPGQPGGTTCEGPGSQPCSPEPPTPGLGAECGVPRGPGCAGGRARVLRTSSRPATSPAWCGLPSGPTQRLAGTAAPKPDRRFYLCAGVLRGLET